MARPVTQERYTKTWAQFKDFLHAKLVNVIDLRRVATLTDPHLLARELRLVVERIVDAENPLLNLMERERLIDEILDDAIGFGPLGILFQDERVREIQVESPQRILLRRQCSFEIADARFRSLEQLYLVSSRLLSMAQGQRLDPPVKAVIQMEVPSNFLMTAEFPASQMQSPILHFRRLQEPPPPPEIPVPTLPRREQQIFIRFVTAFHAVGLDNLPHLDASVARPIAERVVQEFCGLENGGIASEERTQVVETILNEALSISLCAGIPR